MASMAQEKVWRAALHGHLERWTDYASNETSQSERREGWGRLFRAVSEAAPFRDGERVLDLGCGLDSGLDFLPRVRGFSVDPLAARLMPLGFDPGHRPVAGVIESLPFRAESFDRVLVLNVLDHVRGPEAGLAEMRRVLAPDGVLVLSVDTLAGPKLLERRLQRWWKRVRGARTKHPWTFSGSQVVRMIERSGFALLARPEGARMGPRRELFVARKLVST